MAATSNKLVYEFTTDDDELNDEKSDKGTMCDFYKLNLPANASILSKQIAKSQAKRAEKEKRRTRRIDLSTVREQDESRGSASEELSSAISTPAPPKAIEDTPRAESVSGRSRIDSAPIDVKLRRKASLPDEERNNEPMDDEEAQLLAMLLSGITNNKESKNDADLSWTDRKFSLPQNLPSQQPIGIPNKLLPSPGLPKMMPNAKVSEWLHERSESIDNLSIGTSVILEDSGLVLNYQNEEDDDDEFFDAEGEMENVNQKAGEPQNDVGVVELEHGIQGLSLNRNMAMTQSLVRVEEETIQDYGNPQVDPRSARSTSVSPRPTNDQFARNSPINATFNVKHSGTLGRTPKLGLNGNPQSHLTSTPLLTRTARSVLRVHNVNSVTNTSPKQHPQLEQIDLSPITNRASDTRNRVRQPEVSVNRVMSASHYPPTVTLSSAPSRPASVASGRVINGPKMSNLEGLQDLIHMQEEALRKAALESQAEQLERKLSWHSDNEPNRPSIHSSIGSLSSSRSVDGNHTLNKLTSRIPTPRSRLPTPKVLPKRVSIGIQTDNPWPPPCVLRHRSLSMPVLEEQKLMSVFDIPICVQKARVARNSLVSKSMTGESLSAYLLVSSKHKPFVYS